MSTPEGSPPEPEKVPGLIYAAAYRAFAQKVMDDNRHKLSSDPEEVDVGSAITAMLKKVIPLIEQEVGERIAAHLRACAEKSGQVVASLAGAGAEPHARWAASIRDTFQYASNAMARRPSGVSGHGLHARCSGSSPPDDPRCRPAGILDAGAAVPAPPPSRQDAIILPRSPSATGIPHQMHGTPTGVGTWGASPMRIPPKRGLAMADQTSRPAPPVVVAATYEEFDRYCRYELKIDPRTAVWVGAPEHTWHRLQGRRGMTVHAADNWDDVKGLWEVVAFLRTRDAVLPEGWQNSRAFAPPPEPIAEPQPRITEEPKR